MAFTYHVPVSAFRAITTPRPAPAFPTGPNAPRSPHDYTPMAFGGGAGNVTPGAAPKAARRVFLADWIGVPIFDFLALSSRQRISGPVIVESDTACLAPPGLAECRD